MKGYKEPSYQDRVASAQAAKGKARAQMMSKPPLDPADRERRLEMQAAKNEVQQRKLAAAQEVADAAHAARSAEHDAKNERDRVTAEAALAAQPRVLSDAELKEARDSKYAARKARKTGKS